MLIVNYLKKKKKLTEAIVGMFAMVAVCVGVLPNVFAAGDIGLRTSGEVVLDGTADGTVDVVLYSSIADTIEGVQATFQPSVGDSSNTYLTLSALTPGGSITPTSNEPSDGIVYWLDSSLTHGYDVVANGAIWTATYTVDKNTPAGDYVVNLTNAEIITAEADYDVAFSGSLTATVTVTRNDTPESGELPSQVVTFRDADNNPITEITKFYGDEDFKVTKEVTTGDGVFDGYAPNDGESEHPGSIVVTKADDMIGVNGVGDMDVCATVAETENYARTTACFTVHVQKRPLNIVSVGIAPKTYDGTNNATATVVAFDNGSLARDEYDVTATFDDVNAGENVTVHATVTLVGNTNNNYVLRASNFTTTAPIAPYQLKAEDVSLPNGNTYAYNPDGVEPEVRVEANTHGGTSALVKGDDFNVSYSNNTSVTSAESKAHATVTGTGNYMTVDPIVLDFAIEAKGINNSNLIIPSSVVEGHTVTLDEVRINVDGHDLVRCDSVGDVNCDYTAGIQGDNYGEIGNIVHIAVSGCNNYTGVATGNIEVVAKLPQNVTFGDATDTTINRSYGDGDFIYTATSDGDGEIKYSSNNESVATVDENSGQVSIVGIGDAIITAKATETSTHAEGTAKYTVHVVKGQISIVSATALSKTYDGLTDATVTDATLSIDSLVFNTDFTAVGTFNNANAGERVVTVDITLSEETFSHYCFATNDGCENTAVILTNGAINPFTFSVDNSTAAISNEALTYDGTEKEPTATVSADLNGDGTKEAVLNAGTDYTISYGSNVNAGTGNATINGQGNYTGSITGLEFTIDPATVTNVAATATPQDYTGSALEPEVTVTGKVNGADVTLAVDDYEIAAHEDFINAGDHSFSVTAKANGNYTFTEAAGTFTINRIASGNPPEMEQGLRIKAGSTLADLGARTLGFSWNDYDTIIAEGAGNYGATYTKDNDTTNYLTTTDLGVPVYGLKRISIITVVNDGGEVVNPGATALEGDELTWTITPGAGYELASVVVNLEDKIGNVVDNKLTVTAGTDDITVIFRFRRAYNVVRGGGQEHILGVDGVAQFEIDADYELFEDGGLVYVDGELVAEDKYNSWSGSTVIEFTAEYMDSLALGEHALMVEFADGGVARTTFSIKNPVVPEESDNPAAAETGTFTRVADGAVATGVSLLTICILGGVMFFIKKNKKE